MGRKPRIEYEGAVYHVIQRGNNKNYIFEKAEDKRFILRNISEVKDVMNARLFGYVIMSNHYHLLLKTEGKPLNIVMHLINTQYGRYYNGKYGCTGHVFEGRYKGILVKDDKYLLSLLRYIHQNPLKANISKKVEDYKWSSDGFYRNNKADFVDIDFILNMISNNRKMAINKYREFMADEETGDYENIEVIGEDPTVKKGEKTPLFIIKSLDEILEETGASKDDIELIKTGSRKRSLTPYKVEYIKKAIENGYLPKEIAEHINSTTPAIINIKERYKF